jgi:DNA polymerase III subunit gamma/tau
MSDEPFVSLYRRFRPGRFEELRGQSHVVLGLRSAVRDGRVAHAYLFSGPRGTGKTSTARILAKALNCADPHDGEPCGVCSSCIEITRGSSLDVHELDAASNNGVDAMRELIAHAALGTPGRWKVYIVDEVHMLSNAAANALLKTLEEPPGHVVFVLATTDPQKVPATIRSRTQHFEFRLLGTDTLAELVHDVSEAAGLSLDEAALAVVVRRGRGSARDALSALDQAAASGSAGDARPELDEVMESLAEEDAGRALVAVAALHEAGWSPQQLATELVDDLRQAFLVALAPELATADASQLSPRVEKLGLPRLVRSMEVLGRAQVDMREAPDQRVVLEVALVRLARPELDDSTAALGDRLSRLERGLVVAAPAAPEPPAAARPPEDLRTKPSIGALRRQRAQAAAPSESPAQVEMDPAPPPDPTEAAAPPSPAPAPSGDLPERDLLVQEWGDHVLRSLPARAKVLYSAGRYLSVEDGAAVFALPNIAHCDRCQEVRPVVEEALSAHFGVRIPLRLVVEGSAPSQATLELSDGDDFDPTDQGDGQSVAEARLREAFPGAEEV